MVDLPKLISCFFAPATGSHLLGIQNGNVELTDGSDDDVDDVGKRRPTSSTSKKRQKVTSPKILTTQEKEEKISSDFLLKQP